MGLLNSDRLYHQRSKPQAQELLSVVANLMKKHPSSLGQRRLAFLIRQFDKFKHDKTPFNISDEPAVNREANKNIKQALSDILGFSDRPPYRPCESREFCKTCSMNFGRAKLA